MTQLTITIAAGQNPGSTLRKLAKRLEEVALGIPEGIATGTSTVLTIDNAPTDGVVSVQITAGPHAGGVKKC